MRLKDQVAIVTGAASGFGAEIARQYVAQGAKVAVADINGEGAMKVAAELGANAIAVTCDVTKRADIDALAKAMKCGQVYINAYGAGGGVELPFGGVKRSGHGREKGFLALQEFCTIKTIVQYHGR